MCGRYTLFATVEQIVQRFGVQEIVAELPASYNVTPSQMVDVLLHLNGQLVLDTMQWGLIPSWKSSPDNPIINARSETLAEKPSFRQALLHRRCLIPASGFYEWQGKGKDKQPMYVQVPETELFAFAGIWEEWKRPDGTILRSCCIITTEANDTISDIHERMPVILKPENEAQWMNESCRDVPALLSLLVPLPNFGVTFYPVSTLMNSPLFNSPECIARFDPDSVIPEQPSLF